MHGIGKLLTDQHVTFNDTNFIVMNPDVIKAKLLFSSSI